MIWFLLAMLFFIFKMPIAGFIFIFIGFMSVNRRRG